MPDPGPRPVPGPPPGRQAGAPSVDAALAGLDALDQLPVSEHVAVFDTVHRSLQDALATLDEA